MRWTPAHNSTAATLGLPVSDPPTQMEKRALTNKLDELIAAQRREEKGRKA